MRRKKYEDSDESGRLQFEVADKSYLEKLKQLDRAYQHDRATMQAALMVLRPTDILGDDRDGAETIQAGGGSEDAL